MTITIPLTRGLMAVIDNVDYDLISQYKWHSIFTKRGVVYAGTNVQRDGGGYRSVRMHRMITAASPGVEVDHWDGNGLNNTRKNLRCCSHSQNLQNRRAHGVSQYLGVAFDKDIIRKPWAATIGKRRLGRFATEIEAAMAYDAAALVEYGEFARPNFPAGPPPIPLPLARPTEICPVCSTEFETGSLYKPKAFCSMTCLAAARRNSHHPDFFDAAKRAMERR